MRYQGSRWERGCLKELFAGGQSENRRKDPFIQIRLVLILAFSSNEACVMTLCVQAGGGESSGHYPSNTTYPSESLAPTGARNSSEKAEGEIPRAPSAQLRRKKGADPPHSEGREDLIRMDNYNKIEIIRVFFNKLIFNFFFS